MVKSGFKSVITDAIDASGDLKDCIIEPVDYPLIDGKTDVRFRLSVGLALGCDVFSGGIPGVGAAKTVADAIQKQPENGDDEVTHLLTVLSNSSKCLASQINVMKRSGLIRRGLQKHQPRHQHHCGCVACVGLPGKLYV